MNQLKLIEYQLTDIDEGHITQKHMKFWGNLTPTLNRTLPIVTKLICIHNPTTSPKTNTYKAHNLQILSTPKNESNNS
jgi:hypothetical protein